MASLRCPVCGRELEVRCSDSPEPFTAYDPMVGLEAYGAYSAEKEVLHEFEHEGFRVLHLRFGTDHEHLVMLPRGDGTVHSICREQFEEVERMREAYLEFCEKCCLETGIDELCLGCDCDSVRDDLDLDEDEDWEWTEEDEWWDYGDEESY